MTPDTRFKGRSLLVWIELLKDHSMSQRREASTALASMGITAVPELIKLFKSGHGPDRFWAIRTLGYIGRPAKLAVPVIVMALKDGHQEVREEARVALERIDPEAAAKAFGFWYRVRRWFKGGFTGPTLTINADDSREMKQVRRRRD
jgi:hypothetical protein